MPEPTEKRDFISSNFPYTKYINLSCVKGKSDGSIDRGDVILRNPGEKEQEATGSPEQTHLDILKVNTSFSSFKVTSVTIESLKRPVTTQDSVRLDSIHDSSDVFVVVAEVSVSTDRERLC